jgi:hypothetical protein
MFVSVVQLLSLVGSPFAAAQSGPCLEPRTIYNAVEAAGIPGLKQDLPGFLVGKNLSLYPLERVIDRLRVAF